MKLRELFDQELDELIGVKKYKDLTANQIMKKMEDELGLKKMGNGAFGHVIESPSDPNWVYKVIEKDPAYEEYINFVMKVRDNHYPKIKRVKKMTSFFKRYGIQENKFTVIVIEKLEPVPEDKMNFVHDLVNAETLSEVPSVLPNNQPNFSSYTYIELMDEKWPGWKDGEMRDLFEAARDTHRLSRKLDDYFLDLHRGNIMQRKDGTIVLIDPIASNSGIEYGKDVTALKQTRRKMVKGPHYRPEPAQAEPGDDPYAKDNPLPPNDPGTTAWNQQQQQQQQGDLALWNNPNGPTKKAYDEWKVLFHKQSLTPEEFQRFNKLNAYLQQKKKIKEIPRPKGINSPSEAQAEFNRITAKKPMSTADFKRADELNDYLNKVEDVF